jgi:hypothetical protein
VHATATAARGAALDAAAARLDAELGQAAVDAHFALILRACARGGRVALERFCDDVERSPGAIGEAPALSLLAALGADDGGGAAERALRAAAWTMAAQRVAAAWPRTFYAVLEIARTAMALDGVSFEHMQNLGALTACANNTAEADVRDGQRVQFTRESLARHRRRHGHPSGAARHAARARAVVVELHARHRRLRRAAARARAAAPRGRARPGLGRLAP